MGRGVGLIKDEIESQLAILSLSLQTTKRRRVDSLAKHSSVIIRARLIRLDKNQSFTLFPPRRDLRARKDAKSGGDLLDDAGSEDGFFGSRGGVGSGEEDEGFGLGEDVRWEGWSGEVGVDEGVKG